MTRAADQRLESQGLGRAHHRALYFIARSPDLKVSDLLGLLSITKQSLGRVLHDLQERGLVESRVGASDRRQRLLRLSPAGEALARELYEQLRTGVAEAYRRAGKSAVAGFWTELQGLMPEDARGRSPGLPPRISQGPARGRRARTP